VDPIEPTELDAGPVRLRPWREDDADADAAWAAQRVPEIRMWAGGHGVDSRDDRYGDGVKRDELLGARLSGDPPPQLNSRS
jgi:hypothetical protein